MFVYLSQYTITTIIYISYIENYKSMTFITWSRDPDDPTFEDLEMDQVEISVQDAEVFFRILEALGNETTLYLAKSILVVDPKRKNELSQIVNKNPWKFNTKELL